MSRCVAIIQARMGSSRLPGKVMLPFADKTALGFMISRVLKSKSIDDIVLATTKSPTDDVLCEEAKSYGISFFRGSEQDVLTRIYQAAKSYRADIIVRLTADCPLMDGQLIDLALSKFHKGKFDYFSNVMQRSFPDGLDVEIFTANALLMSYNDCSDNWSREHVTPFMRSGTNLPIKTGQFFVGHFKASSNYSHLRWTLDTPSDYEFFTELLKHDIIEMSWQDIISLTTRNPDLLMWSRGDVGPPNLPANNKSVLPHSGYNASVKHLKRALKTIPVGSQTVSKSYIGWVVGSAPFYAKSGSGAIITDVDGNNYIDYMMALLPVVLGYSDPFVDAAVVRQLQHGVSLSLSSVLEAELSEKLVSLIPCAEMVRFGKNGSDATTAAVRLARAFNLRDKVIVCGYHGWHDWFIGTTVKSSGVPCSIRELSLVCPFNDANALNDLLIKHGKDVSALVIEPTGKEVPKEGFLLEARRLCDHHGVILIFDEVISGFRINMGGAQAEYGVTPDLAAFGKAMANGYPISALVGRKDIMVKMEDIFFSTTFGGELASIAAALATIKKLESTNAIGRIQTLGYKMMSSLNDALALSGLGETIRYSGEGWWPRVVFENMPLEQSKATALIRQEFAEQNLLIASGLNFCLAHDDQSIFEETVSRATKAFEKLAVAINSSDPKSFIRGDIATSDFEVRGHFRG